MSKTIVLEIDDADYERLLQEAQAEGRKVEEVAVQRLRPLSSSVANQDVPTPLTSSPALNGPNSDWEQILQQFALSQSARHGGTPKTHLARLQVSLRPRPDASTASDEQTRFPDPMERHFGAIDSGDPHSADNDRIDADLARYYLRELDGNEDAA